MLNFDFVTSITTLR